MKRLNNNEKNDEEVENNEEPLQEKKQKKKKQTGTVAFLSTEYMPFCMWKKRS